MLFWISAAAVVVVLFLSWNLYRRFGADRIAAFSERRRPTSRIVSRGAFFDGNRRIEVALALTGETFYYENADMEASLDLQWVREIEYDTRLATGSAIESGKVLRLRCYSQTFEFLLPDDMVVRWHMMLPPRRDMRPPAGQPAMRSLAATAAGAL
jgi:hypothetical protein